MASRPARSPPGSARLTGPPILVPMPEQPSAAAFITALARGLHGCGVSSHRLEATLNRVSERLGLPLQVFGLPTGLFLSWSGPAGPATTQLLRVQPGRVDLERLSRLDEIADAVIAGTMQPGPAESEVHRILAAPAPRGPLAVVAAHVAASAAFGVFFGGGAAEVATASVIGLAAGIIAVRAESSPGFAPLAELTTAAVAAVIAAAAHRTAGPVSEYVATLAGLILLMPGIALTGGLNELANQHLASGTARLAGAAVVLLALVFGTAVGRTIVLLAGPDNAPVQCVPLPEAWLLPALLAVSAADVVIFRARWGDLPTILGACSLAMAATRLGTAMLGPQTGMFAAALVLGCGSNLYARLAGRPAYVPLIPGLAMLVPGAAGYRGLSAMGEDVLSGVTIGYGMTMTAIALVAGLLFSHVIAPAQKRI